MKIRLFLSYLFLLTTPLFSQYPTADSKNLASPMIAEPDSDNRFPANPANLSESTFDIPDATGKLTADFLRYTFYGPTDYILGLVRDPSSYALIFNDLWNLIIDDQFYNDLFANTSFGGSDFITGIDDGVTNAQTHYDTLITDMFTRGGTAIPPWTTAEWQDEVDAVFLIVNTDKIEIYKNIEKITKEKIKTIYEYLSQYDTDTHTNLGNVLFAKNGFGFAASLDARGSLTYDPNAELKFDLTRLREIAYESQSPNIPSPLDPIVLFDNIQDVFDNIYTDFEELLGDEKFQKEFLYSVYQNQAFKIMLFTELGLNFGLYEHRDPISVGVSLNLHAFTGYDDITWRRYITPEDPEPTNILDPPIAFPFGLHAGIDLGTTFTIFKGFTLGLVITDIVGITPGTQNASKMWMGDFIYSPDIDIGIYYHHTPHRFFRFFIGVDLYDTIDMTFQRSNRFSTRIKPYHHLRGKIGVIFSPIITIQLQYYNDEISAGVEFNFETYRPSFALSYSPEREHIGFDMNILRFVW